MSLLITQQLIGDPNISQAADARISVPNTTIVNRASIVDLSKGMAPSMGVERIMTQSIYQLQNEFGANGEPVWGAVNDDIGRIRFVGGWLPRIDSNGSNPYASTSGNDYVEVVFYGTGLNYLTGFTGGTNTDARVTIDGGTEGGNIQPQISVVYNGRNYSHNVPVTAASGLSLGVHTVRIRSAGTNANTLVIYGFEVLNESSTLRINSGSLISAQRKVSLETAQALAFKPASLTGTKGGRVVTYSQGGVIGQSVQAVDAAAAFLTSANHNNEEIARKHHWREFGAGRGDDFSTLSSSASNRVFTLDDGTTTLVGSTPSNTGETIQLQDTSFIALTFVGTGLDAEIVYQGGTIDTYTVSVNGSSIGTISTQTASTRITKLVSGLPYGTHVVRIARSGVSFPGIFFKGFIVYQPRKPSLPTGAVELADYNVMADFASNSSAAQDTIATGTLRKTAWREFTYVDGTGGTGNWSTNYGISIASPAGIQLNNDQANCYFEYTFFGTGFDYRLNGGGAGSSNVTCTLNGTAFNASYPGAASINCSVYGGTVTYGGQGPNTSFLLSAVASNSMNQGTTGTGNGFRVSGLPLGRYTVRFTQSAGSGAAIRFCALDIITPIHSVKSNLYADLQNTLPVGSQSLQDSRQLVSSNVVPQKAWAQAVGVTSAPTTTSATLIPCPDMSVTIRVNNPARLRVFYNSNFNISINATATFVVYLNGTVVSAQRRPTSISAGYNSATDCIVVPVSAGAHKIDVYWATNGGTMAGDDKARTLLVEEL